MHSPPVELPQLNKSEVDRLCFVCIEGSTDIFINVRNTLSTSMMEVWDCNCHLIKIEVQLVSEERIEAWM